MVFFFFSLFNITISEYFSEISPNLVSFFLITFRKQSLNPSDQNEAVFLLDIKNV